MRYSAATVGQRGTTTTRLCAPDCRRRVICQFIVIKQRCVVDMHVVSPYNVRARARGCRATGTHRTGD